MRNKEIFIIVFIAVALALCGILFLIFPKFSAMMGWCMISGFALIATLAYKIFMVSSHENLTVKNAATTWALYSAALTFFLWTIAFVFLFGSYKDNDRSLNGLYIGYLIIFIIGIVLWLMVDRGGSIAQAHSDVVQNNIQGRGTFINQLQLLKLKLEEIEPDTRSDAHKSLAQNIDLMRNIPSSKFSSPDTSKLISEAITTLADAIHSADIDNFTKANKNLEFTLKSFRI